MVVGKAIELHLKLLWAQGESEEHIIKCSTHAKAQFKARCNIIDDRDTCNIQLIFVPLSDIFQSFSCHMIRPQSDSFANL